MQFSVPMHHRPTHVIPRRGVSPDVGIPIDIPEIWRGLPRQSADWLAMTQNFGGPAQRFKRHAKLQFEFIYNPYNPEMFSLY